MAVLHKRIPYRLLSLLLCIHAAVFQTACTGSKEVSQAAPEPVTVSAEPVVTPESSDTPNPDESPLPTEETISDALCSYRTEELPFTVGEKYIYGHAFIPNAGKDTYPTVILCHGIGNDHCHIDYLGMMLGERGIAAYTFDFCGGGENSESSGAFSDMSVRTEAEDLKDVMDYVLSLEFTDPNNLFLLGQSQGGYVVTETAPSVQDSIRGIILMFPAFNINDLISEQYSDPSAVPQSGVIFDQTVGRCYFIDAMAEDIEADMQAYNGSVLLLHGTEDDIVPIEYSRHALDLFPNAELVTIEGASHGFFGEDAVTAVNACITFIHDHTVQDSE